MPAEAQTTRRFQPTEEEASFLHAFEALFAPRPAWPDGRKERGSYRIAA